MKRATTWGKKETIDENTKTVEVMGHEVKIGKNSTAQQIADIIESKTGIKCVVDTPRIIRCHEPRMRRRNN